VHGPIESLQTQLKHKPDQQVQYSIILQNNTSKCLTDKTVTYARPLAFICKNYGALIKALTCKN